MQRCCRRYPTTLFQDANCAAAIIFVHRYHSRDREKILGEKKNWSASDFLLWDMVKKRIIFRPDLRRVSTFTRRKLLNIPDFSPCFVIPKNFFGALLTSILRVYRPDLGVNTLTWDARKMDRRCKCVQEKKEKGEKLSSMSDLGHINISRPRGPNETISLIKHHQLRELYT